MQHLAQPPKPSSDRNPAQTHRDDVTATAFAPHLLREFRPMLLPVAWVLLGLLALGALPWMSDPMTRYVDIVLAFGAIAYGAARMWQARSLALAKGQGLPRDLAALVMQDPSAVVMARRGGAVLQINTAADALLRDVAAAHRGNLAQALSKFIASPAPLIARLEARAMATGSATEDIAARDGALRLTVIKTVIKTVSTTVNTTVNKTGTAPKGSLMLWRIDAALSPYGAGTGAESLGLPMLTANKAGTVLFSNAAMRQVLGARPKALRDIAPPAQWRTGEALTIATESGPKSVQLVELAGRGERREIYFLPLQGETAQGAETVASFDMIPVALLVFNPAGEMQAANPAAREMLGDLLGGTPAFHDLFDALGRPVSDWLADVAAARLPQGAQVLRLLRPRGEGQDFVHVALRRMLVAGHPMVAAVVQDANALKTLEEQFTQSQKMQAIGQLAGGVAHDFNNLLTAISGNCDLLLLRHTGDDPSFPDLMQIRQNANRAASLVSQLLAFSRKTSLQPEYLEMQDVFSDLAHLLNRLVGEKLRLVLHHMGEVGTIRADRRQLEQVIMNLVVNARDAMPQGGSIAITTEAVHLTEALQRDRANVPAGQYARISVADTGTGIAPEILPKIFDPFFTTKKAGEGTGLGLSTAYGIVKQSGGFIFVDSALGQGTTFTLYFPIHNIPAEAKRTTSPAKTHVIRQGQGVVLLVEDEAPVRAFAARALRLRGYTVLEAATGEDALALLREGAVQVDLFISDVIMPGMDGPTWVREAQVLHPDVPVIFMSGYAEDVMSEHQQRIAHSSFLPKPFSLADLTLAVQEKLRGAAEDAGETAGEAAKETAT